MIKEPSELKIAYNHETGVISLQTYDEGFFYWENDITIKRVGASTLRGETVRAASAA